MNTKQIIKDLKRTFEVLRSREKWVQGTYRSSKFVGESYVETYCLVGAMRKVSASQETLEYLAKCLPNRPVVSAQECKCDSCNAQRHGEVSIVNWNDQANTTYEDVVLLLKSAIYALEEEEEE